MNQAAFDLASRKDLCQAVKKESFLKMKRGEEKKISKECIVSGKVAFLVGREGASRQVIFLVLTRLIAG